MTKNRFSEPEQYLMTRWADVEMLRQSIKSIGDKYGEICEEVYAAVKEKYPKLNYPGIHATSSGGQIGIGKREWPSMYDTWPSGLWVYDFGLEILASEEDPPPSCGIWLKPPTRLGFDLDQAKRKVRSAAKKLLTPEQLARLGEDDDRWTCFWYPLPESRQDLLDMLLKDQVQDFVECLVSHFEVLAKFIPVIDELFEAQKPVRKT
jgi:hypothetical protein